nr:MAG TPA: hypothetical protein [Caudoviricetes sp.]
MARSSDAVLFATPVLVPTAVLRVGKVPANKRVAASNDLPPGWHAVLLNLWPDAMEAENHSLIAVLARPRPNLTAKRSDGELLRSIRRRVHGWLHATDVPAAERHSVSEARGASYAAVETFATGKPGGWGAPLTTSGDRKPVPSTAGTTRPHKPHGPRRDIYWVLTTDKGHRVLHKAASAVGRAMSSGSAPVPPGWHLARGVEYGDGSRGSPAKKILRVRADYDADPSIPLAQRLAIEAFVTWIKNAARNPMDGR